MKFILWSWILLFFVSGIFSMEQEAVGVGMNLYFSSRPNLLTEIQIHQDYDRPVHTTIRYFNGNIIFPDKIKNLNPVSGFEKIFQEIGDYRLTVLLEQENRIKIKLQSLRLQNYYYLVDLGKPYFNPLKVEGYANQKCIAKYQISYGMVEVSNSTYPFYRKILYSSTIPRKNIELNFLSDFIRETKIQIKSRQISRVSFNDPKVEADVRLERFPVFLKNRHTGKAMEDYLTALLLNPPYLANASIELLDKFHQRQKSILKINPEDYNEKFYLGLILWAKGDYTQSARELEELKQKNYLDNKILFNLWEKQIKQCREWNR